MKKSLFVFLKVMLLVACGGQPQMKSFSTELTSGDSLLISMGQWELTRFHSDKLGIDINYPSFLYHQDLPDEQNQELFMADDVSISVIVDSMNGMNYSASQQMMGMGAELIDVTDNYTLQTGQDDQWEYYGKVMDDDSARLVTVMLRYYPEHADAMEALKEWVRNFKLGE